MFSYGSERRRDGPTQKADLRGGWKAELSLHEIGHSVRKEPEIIHLEEVLQRPIETTRLIRTWHDLAYPDGEAEFDLALQTGMSRGELHRLR